MEEIRGAVRSAEDILVICRKFMADPQPYAVKTLVSAAQAAKLRASFAQPGGVAPRKPIGAQVQRSIQTRVGPLLRQGALSTDGAAYLSNWAAGTLTVLQRPSAYSCLTYRYEREPANEELRVAWGPAAREKHVDLTLPADDVSETGSEDDLRPAPCLA